LAKLTSAAAVHARGQAILNNISSRYRLIITVPLEFNSVYIYTTLGDNPRLLWQNFPPIRMYLTVLLLTYGPTLGCGGGAYILRGWEWSEPFSVTPEQYVSSLCWASVRANSDYPRVRHWSLFL